MTNECLKTMSTVKKALGIMRPDSVKLIDKTLLIHKDVSDNDLVCFIRKAINFDVPATLSENAIVLVNENCICFMQQNKFYLFPATIAGICTNGDNKFNCYVNYKNSVSVKDFLEIA